MLTGKGLDNIKIIDFGIAGQLDRSLFQDKMKRAGTLKFMPPEIISSEDKSVDS